MCKNVRKTFQHTARVIAMGEQSPMISASAPAKCVLFGEHAVVYGQPAIAVALNLRTTVSIQTSKKMQIEGRKFNPNSHPHIDFLLKKLWNQSNDFGSLSIQIESEIPSASGLGSSAALCNALVACLRSARGRKIDDDGQWLEGWSSNHQPSQAYIPELTFDAEAEASKRIFGKEAISIDECGLLAHAAEAIAQGGLASPMDTTTSAHGGLILIGGTQHEHMLYKRELNVEDSIRQWDISQIESELSDDVYLVIGATGIRSSTKKQVEHVAQLLASSEEHRGYIEDIGNISLDGYAAMNNGDFEEVGRLMNQNQILLEKLEVSSTPLRRLIRAALPFSLGTKLSGAGGGGCMIALTKQPESTSRAIEEAGGTSYITSISKDGVRLEHYENIVNS
jgi:mevalonate kinase